VVVEVGVVVVEVVEVDVGGDVMVVSFSDVVIIFAVAVISFRVIILAVVSSFAVVTEVSTSVVFEIIVVASAAVAIWLVDSIKHRIPTPLVKYYLTRCEKLTLTGLNSVNL
jgi:hypothetical protein